MSGTTGPAGRRGSYSERVRAYFDRPVHAGDLPAGSGPGVLAEASEGGAGARILLTAVTDNAKLSVLRFRVFGCPHLIAAAEAVCERFEGKPVKMLAEFTSAELMKTLDVPIEKTGRLLLLEDALHSLESRLGQPDDKGN